MNIALQVDTKPFEAINRKREKRIVFGVVKALRTTAERIQRAEHDRERAQFTVRKESFFFGSEGQPGGVGAKLGPRPDIASGRMYQEIYVGQARPSGKSQLLLSEFEAGGTREPFAPGAKKVAVPVRGGPARPSAQSSVPQPYTFAGLKLKKYRFDKRVRGSRGRKDLSFKQFGSATSKAGRAQQSGVYFKGLQRTYEVPDVGVFQRFASGDEGSRLIWGFIPPFPIDKRLEFVRTAEAVAARWFHEEMQNQAAQALNYVR